MACAFRENGAHFSAHGGGASTEGESESGKRASYRINPGNQMAMGGNSMTRARAMMLMRTKGMTPR